MARRLGRMSYCRGYGPQYVRNQATANSPTCKLPQGQQQVVDVAWEPHCVVQLVALAVRRGVLLTLLVLVVITTLSVNL